MNEKNEQWFQITWLFNCSKEIKEHNYQVWVENLYTAQKHLAETAGKGWTPQ